MVRSPIEGADFHGRMNACLSLQELPRRLHASWMRHAAPRTSLSGAATSRLVNSLQCAAQLATSIAAERAACWGSRTHQPLSAGGYGAGGGGGGSSGAAGNGAAWAMYVASDAPGLR